MRKSLNKAIDFTGVGLHGGQQVVMTVSPAEAGTGIVFVRIDVPLEKQSIPARYDLVTDTQLCTKLTNAHGVSVGTVEHIMAALAGCGITDAIIALDGPEVPIMDGSSVKFVEAFLKVGIAELSMPCKAIRILETVRVEKDGKWAELRPADRFEMDFHIIFQDAAIGEQRESLTMVNGTFVNELSDCRTFGHLQEVEYLRKLGLARGGSLQNAIVVENGRVLNPEGLRRPDEFVRHKMLDAVGDLALAGAPIIGRYSGEKAGHEMTNLLLHALFDRPQSWCWDTLEADQGLGGQLSADRTSRKLQAVAV